MSVSVYIIVLTHRVRDSKRSYTVLNYSTKRIGRIKNRSHGVSSCLCFLPVNFLCINHRIHHRFNCASSLDKKCLSDKLTFIFTHGIGASVTRDSVPCSSATSSYCENTNLHPIFAMRSSNKLCIDAYVYIEAQGFELYRFYDYGVQVTQARV